MTRAEVPYPLYARARSTIVDRPSDHLYETIIKIDS